MTGYRDLSELVLKQEQYKCPSILVDVIMDCDQFPYLPFSHRR